MSGARHKARLRTIEVLYESEVRQVSVAQVIDRRHAQPAVPISEYTEHLAREIDTHREHLDALIAHYAIGWTLERMPVVDRNILRMGTCELMFSTEIPDAVAVSEAVEVARELSSEDAPGFVSGLLTRMLEHKDSLPG